MIRKLLGIAPQPTEDGAYSPSRLSLKLATAPVTDYQRVNYDKPYTDGKLKVLMLCTEEKYMTMKNGKKFSTGNHPVEMLVPMLHFEEAGFKTDVFTPNGKAAKIEMWAMPEKDQAVNQIFEDYREKFDHPKSLAELVEKQGPLHADYAAVFIPGGHGAMLGLPQNEHVKKLIHQAYQEDLLMLSICHGPAAFLAANINEAKEDFIFKGYKMAAFPDSVDKQTPLVGYMPGHLKWKFGEKLRELGVEIINKKADKSCFQDRKLITGASPDAANNFGKLAALALLQKVHE